MLLAAVLSGLLLATVFTGWALHWMWRNCTILRWDDAPVFAECKSCGGLGYLWPSGGVVPRHMWHMALWAMGNRRLCKACMGRGMLVTRPKTPVAAGEVVNAREVQP